eukprot:gene5742-4103_t
MFWKSSNRGLPLVICIFLFFSVVHQRNAKQDPRQDTRKEVKRTRRRLEVSWDTPTKDKIYSFGTHTKNSKTEGRSWFTIIIIIIIIIIIYIYIWSLTNHLPRFPLDIVGSIINNIYLFIFLEKKKETKLRRHGKGSVEEREKVRRSARPTNAVIPFILLILFLCLIYIYILSITIFYLFIFSFDQLPLISLEGLSFAFSFGAPQPDLISLLRAFIRIRYETKRTFLLFLFSADVAVLLFIIDSCCCLTLHVLRAAVTNFIPLRRSCVVLVELRRNRKTNDYHTVSKNKYWISHLYLYLSLSFLWMSNGSYEDRRDDGPSCTMRDAAGYIARDVPQEARLPTPPQSKHSVDSSHLPQQSSCSRSSSNRSPRCRLCSNGNCSVQWLQGEEAATDPEDTQEKRMPNTFEMPSKLFLCSSFPQDDLQPQREAEGIQQQRTSLPVRPRPQQEPRDTTPLGTCTIQEVIAPSPPVAPGDALVKGLYTLEKLLGKGSSGTVFQARQKGSDELVAIKICKGGADSRGVSHTSGVTGGPLSGCSAENGWTPQRGVLGWRHRRPQTRGGGGDDSSTSICASAAQQTNRSPPFPASSSMSGGDDFFLARSMSCSPYRTAESKLGAAGSAREPLLHISLVPSPDIASSRQAPPLSFNASHPLYSPSGPFSSASAADVAGSCSSIRPEGGSHPPVGAGAQSILQDSHPRRDIQPTPTGDSGGRRAATPRLRSDSRATPSLPSPYNAASTAATILHEVHVLEGIVNYYRSITKRKVLEEHIKCANARRKEELNLIVRCGKSMSTRRRSKESPQKLRRQVVEDFRSREKACGTYGFRSPSLCPFLYGSSLTAFRSHPFALSMPSSRKEEVPRFFEWALGYQHMVSQLIATPISTGKSRGHRYLVLPLLGPSLRDVQLNYLPERKLPLQHVVQVGVQLLHAIECIHTAGFVHRDIKPSNILLPKAALELIPSTCAPSGIRRRKSWSSTELIQDSRFYPWMSLVRLIDFSHSAAYLDPITYHHVKIARMETFLGSPSFASLRTHQLYLPSRRDDMEQLVYVLVYLLKGELPWYKDGNTSGADLSTSDSCTPSPLLQCTGLASASGLHPSAAANSALPEETAADVTLDGSERKRNAEEKRIATLKASLTEDEICEGCPAAFSTLLKYARTLGYDETPGYNWCEQQLLDLTKEVNDEGVLFSDPMCDVRGEEEEQMEKEKEEEEEEEDRGELSFKNCRSLHDIETEVRRAAPPCFVSPHTPPMTSREEAEQGETPHGDDTPADASDGSHALLEDHQGLFCTPQRLTNVRRSPRAEMQSVVMDREEQRQRSPIPFHCVVSTGQLSPPRDTDNTSTATVTTLQSSRAHRVRSSSPPTPQYSAASGRAPTKPCPAREHDLFVSPDSRAEVTAHTILGDTLDRTTSQFPSHTQAYDPSPPGCGSSSCGKEFLKQISVDGSSPKVTLNRNSLFSQPHSGATSAAASSPVLYEAVLGSAAVAAGTVDAASSLEATRHPVPPQCTRDDGVPSKGQAVLDHRPGHEGEPRTSAGLIPQNGLATTAEAAAVRHARGSIAAAVDDTAASAAVAEMSDPVLPTRPKLISAHSYPGVSTKLYGNSAMDICVLASTRFPYFLSPIEHAVAGGAPPHRVQSAPVPAAYTHDSRPYGRGDTDEDCLSLTPPHSRGGPTKYLSTQQPEGELETLLAPEFVRVSTHLGTPERPLSEMPLQSIDTIAAAEACGPVPAGERSRPFLFQAVVPPARSTERTPPEDLVFLYEGSKRSGEEFARGADSTLRELQLRAPLSRGCSPHAPPLPARPKDSPPSPRRVASIRCADQWVLHSCPARRPLEGVAWPPTETPSALPWKEASPPPAPGVVRTPIDRPAQGGPAAARATESVTRDVVKPMVPPPSSAPLKAPRRHSTHTSSSHRSAGHSIPFQKNRIESSTPVRGGSSSACSSINEPPAKTPLFTHDSDTSSTASDTSLPRCDTNPPTSEPGSCEGLHSSAGEPLSFLDYMDASRAGSVKGKAFRRRHIFSSLCQDTHTFSRCESGHSWGSRNVSPCGGYAFPDGPQTAVTFSANQNMYPQRNLATTIYNMKLCLVVNLFFLWGVDVVLLSVNELFYLFSSRNSFVLSQQSEMFVIFSEKIYINSNYSVLEKSGEQQKKKIKSMKHLKSSNDALFYYRDHKDKYLTRISQILQIIPNVLWWWCTILFCFFFPSSRKTQVHNGQEDSRLDEVSWENKRINKSHPMRGNDNLTAKQKVCYCLYIEAAVVNGRCECPTQTHTRRKQVEAQLPIPYQMLLSFILLFVCLFGAVDFPVSIPIGERENGRHTHSNREGKKYTCYCWTHKIAALLLSSSSSLLYCECSLKTLPFPVPFYFL